MNGIRAGMLLILTISGSALCKSGAGPVATQQADEPSQSPLKFKFCPSSPSFGLHDAVDGVPSCGVPEGRQQSYDPKTGVFHVHFKSRNFSRSAFEVTQVADRFTKPVAFRLTGVPKQYGCVGTPLALSVGGKRYSIEDGDLATAPADKSLFKVERVKEVVTIEFTEKGQMLLKSGAQISFAVDTGW